MLEDTSPAARDAYEADTGMLVWWGAEIECVSAISRLERRGGLALDEAEAALRQLDRLQAGWTETEAALTVRFHARRLLRVHNLRAADALQLGAALVVAEAQPSRAA